MRKLRNEQIYLERLAKPLQEKLKIARYVSPSAKQVLDVGCADGTVTLALSDLYPTVNFRGIDISDDFIALAKSRIGRRNNVSFERVYLRDLLAKPQRFDTVIFCSVLHEFYTYGEGISSVLKALADAHELIIPGGRLLLRDMILFEYSKEADLWSEKMLAKVRKPDLMPLIADFERQFGKVNSIYRLNHFLLKYWYTDNWAREGKENYVPVSFEQYNSIFRLLGMRLQFIDSYLIPFLQDKWVSDFEFLPEELANFRSTGIIVAEKPLVSRYR